MNIKNILNIISEKKLKKDNDDPCWDNYAQLGMKKKSGKEVPNCIPKESVDDDFMRDQGGSGSAAARGSVKKIKGHDRWWAKNRGGTMKIFDTEQKAKRFAMTNESINANHLYEKVELDHARYLRSHGKKARGKGTWMFTSKPMGEPKGDEMVTINGDLSSAAKEAAKKLGTNRVYVMESIQLDESVDLTEDVHNDLSDLIIDFQRKLMNITRRLDPAIAKEIKKIDKDLDELRTGPLHKIRPGR
jgi:hypothetical protein